MRNYIEAGSYIEIFFPKHNVRYVTVTDGVDSLTRQETGITPFKNILNDMYGRDISKKVLAGRTRRESAPVPMTSFPVRNGKSMQVRYEKVGRTGKNRFTREERERL